MTTVTDFLQNHVGTSLQVAGGLWVRIRNNDTAVDYYSSTTSDPSSGAFTVTAPPGVYALYTGAAATVPGTPTMQSAYYAVPVTAGDDVVVKSLTGKPFSPYAVQPGVLPGEVVSAVNPFNPKAYGARHDGVTNDTAAWAATLTAMGSTGRVIEFAGSAVIASSLQSNTVGVTVMGLGRKNGSEIRFSGSGPLFDIGTDNGQPYDGNYYDGPEGWKFESLLMRTINQSTPLDNGAGNYTPGTIGIRDWRGGSVVTHDVSIWGFDYPFWGIQSDENYHSTTTVFLCHSGWYLGPRSDQASFYGCNFFGNDRHVDIDRAQQPMFNHTTFVDGGTATTNPIRIRTGWTNSQWGSSFVDCWFEQYIYAAVVEAFIEFGVGDTVQSYQLNIIRPKVLCNISGGAHHVQYLVKVGNATVVEIQQPGVQVFSAGSDTSSSLDALVSCVAATSPDILIHLPQIWAGSNLGKVVSSGGATPNVIVENWGSTRGKSISSGKFMVGSDTLAAAVELDLNAAAGQNRDLIWKTGNSPRIIARLTSTAETGANAGSDWSLSTRDDVGNLLMAVLAITRATGAATFGGTLTAVGLLTGSAGLVVGANAFATGSQVVINGAAASNRDLIMQTAGSARLIVRLTNTAESGGNAGSDVAFITRDDTGAAILQVLLITRSSGLFTFGEGVNFGLGTATGTKFGMSTNQKLAFHNATPVIQRAGAAQVAVATTASTQATPWGFSTQAQADGLVTLANEMRAWAVEKGFIKGAA